MPGRGSIESTAQWEKSKIPWERKKVPALIASLPEP
jgi:hypothetical protein